ncbi:MAG: hypothetical protein ACRC33_23640 [Gemmataceae bacterium]
MTMSDDARRLLEAGTTPTERKLNAPLTAELLADLRAWLRLGRPARPWLSWPWRRDEPPALAAVIAWLRGVVAREEARFAALGRLHAELQRRCAQAAGPAEVERFVLDFARDLGATPAQLRGDREALRRWFGLDAVTDRYLLRRAAAERKLAWCLRRLGALAAQHLRGEPARPREAWRALELEPAVAPRLRHAGDTRVAVAAFRCLAEAIRALGGSAERVVGDDTVAYIYRAALDARMPTWIQCEAVELLQHLSIDSLGRVLETRLQRPEGGDDLFVRRAAVRVLGENLARRPELSTLVPAAAADPGPFVRQELARVLASGPEELAREWLPRLAHDDAVAAVRAAAVWEGRALAGRAGLAGLLLEVLARVLEREADAFVLRVAIHTAAEAVPALAGEAGVAAVLAALDRLHAAAPRLAVRRWAAQARERIWCDSDAEARTLKHRLQAELATLRPGRSRWLARPWLRRDDEARVGRVLAVLAQEDFGYDVRWGWWGARVTRGWVFGFRLWRFLHEMGHPDPAKRQAFRHTIGRVSDADLRVPSGVLSELAETKVPGEPLFIGTEGGWRPYLPLMDDVVSCLNRGPFRPRVRFCTSEGVTELTAPRSLLGRLWAHVRLNRSFARLARLRNWQEGDPASPSTFLRAVEECGFRVAFRPWGEDGATPDPAVTRFFPSVLPLAVAPELTDIWQRFTTYFISSFENTSAELAVFLAVAGSAFLGWSWYLSATMRGARQAIPLVMGGWGTRGKSGTERLKAALINALGHSMVSKTTGCEAMFLYATAYGKVRELFLYRSYDKATIWEQRMMVQLARQLAAEVFLWECMGLTPAYVEVLQQRWMNDDVSTLTNTYPDHEDVQGPAGINIPEVMTYFIPTRSRLLTSEEQMRPILSAAAAERGTVMRSVGWLEAGLLPPDVLARFPYEEHPYNIALVMAVADELGLPGDYALKEMADRVVPDLGVLKTSPDATIRTRRLRFSNGMSANERHGCLNNWVRMGFDRQDADAEPGVWLTTVVNNRADRIPRSRVFAAILVNDLSADRHFLIGGNLNGLKSYVREAWDEWVGKITLWPETDPDDPAGVLRAFAKRFRRPTTDEAVQARLGVTLAGLGLDPAVARAADGPDRLRAALQQRGVEAALAESAVTHLAADLAGVAEYRALAGRLEGSPARREVDAALHALLWNWFETKLVVVEDYHATGDAIIDLIAEQTPPGFLNRVMGIQNIKGTGLDFVYRWEAWGACHRLCVAACDPDPGRAEAGLRELALFKDYGVLCEEFVHATAEKVRAGPLGRREAAAALLEAALGNMAGRMGEVRAAMAKQVKAGGWLASALGALETVLDVSAALRRRQRANQIYADLGAERIGMDRAVRELQAVTKEQKGGWLLEWFLGPGKKES